MNYKVKGIGLITVVAIGAGCLVVGAVGGYLYGKGGGGFGLGGGNGSALIGGQEENRTIVIDPQPDENTNSSVDIAMEDLSESATEATKELSTEPVTIPIIENLDTVEIVISGNGYLYRNTPVSLEAVKGIFQTLVDDYTIKITDKKASLKAYNNLTDLLKEMGMHYIEVTS